MNLELETLNLELETLNPPAPGRGKLETLNPKPETRNFEPETLLTALLAFLFYRWEVIMRETAILGILGIYTLGFYVDSAIADIRIDRAVLLIAITALLNIAVDVASRTIRGRLRLATTPDAA